MRSVLLHSLQDLGRRSKGGHVHVLGFRADMLCFTTREVWIVGVVVGDCVDALCIGVDSPSAALILQNTSPCLSSILSLLAVLRIAESIVKKVGAAGCPSSDEGCSFHGVTELQI